MSVKSLIVLKFCQETTQSLASSWEARLQIPSLIPQFVLRRKSLRYTILTVPHSTQKYVISEKIFSASQQTKANIKNKAIVDIRLRLQCAIPPPSRPIIGSSNACNQVSAPIWTTVILKGSILP